MLHFIFDDDRYAEAGDPPARLLTAFLIIIEFPIQLLLYVIIDGSIMLLKQLIVFVKYVAVLLVIGACCVMIYTNALFSVAVVMEQLSPFSRLSWLDVAFCVALACSVALWLPVYVMAAAVRPNVAAVKGGGEKPAKPNATWGVVRLRAGGAVAVATVVLFFVHWNVYGRYGALIRSYDVMPDKVMEISANLACRFQRVSARSRLRCNEEWGAAMTPVGDSRAAAQGLKGSEQKVR